MTSDATAGQPVLHPAQFQVNEAWIAFKLNDEPIRTEQEGDFDFVALMDAASCFILSTAPVSTKRAELTKTEATRLLKDSQAHRKAWPKKLFVPAELSAEIVATEARRLGIEIVRVAESELVAFIGEAQEGFRERFGGG